MSFTSIPFLWFLAAFLTLYGLCPAAYRRYLLLLGSLVFIALGSVRVFVYLAVFLTVFALCPAHWRRYLLLLGSAVFLAVASGLFHIAADSERPAFFALGFTLANLLLGDCIAQGTNRKLMLSIAVAIDAMFLATFKLANAGLSGSSFYLFSFMAYLVEVYRGTVQAATDLIRFANYSLFFPKFTQGPITRYSEMAEQLDKPHITGAAIQKGLEDFALGFVLKLLVSDRLSVLFSETEYAALARNPGFDYISTDLAWFGALVTSLHIYIEWIAYMYMALGIACMLGYKLPQNFNYPYAARTVGEYYRRWHMTLTRWFKDFIYIPLGGSRKGLGKTIVNVLFVWLLTSLWHGNGLAPKYLLWGIVSGAVMLFDPICCDWFAKRSLREKPELGTRIMGHLPLLLLLLVSILVLREPASGYNFILWGMSIGVLIVLERLWKTFVVERFQLGKRFDPDSMLGKAWKLIVSALAHLWVIVTMVLSWVAFTIKDYDQLKLYFTRLFPAAGASAGFAENDIQLYWWGERTHLAYCVIVGVIFCFPLTDRVIRMIKRTRWGTWIVSAILAGLFWYAVYILSVKGSNPMGYSNF